MVEKQTRPVKASIMEGVLLRPVKSGAEIYLRSGQDSVVLLPLHGCSFDSLEWIRWLRCLGSSQLRNDQACHCEGFFIILKETEQDVQVGLRILWWTFKR